jgi:uncharacterized protein YbaR (Trm112 family)
VSNEPCFDDVEERCHALHSPSYTILAVGQVEWGFEPNPYDSCVVNKMVNGKQCTIGWHVDDLRISHVDSKVVDHVIELMDAEFGKEAPLTVSRDKVHAYLGMQFDFTVQGEVTVDMSNYVRIVIAEMPEDMTGKATTPAANHLFDIREENPVLLDKEKSDTFHRMSCSYNI